MTRVLFICHGNICRSPMAEMVMKHMVSQHHLEDQFHIDSAATSREEIGNRVHHGTRQKLAEQGIPCEDHRAIQLTRQDYVTYDYLVAMDSWNLRNIRRIIGEDTEGKVHLLLDFTDRKGQDIADPWYTGNFDATFRDVQEGCQGLLNELLDRQ